MKRIKTILLILVLLLLVACQPTPEQEVVVNKADGKLEEMIFATPQATSETTPSVQETPSKQASEVSASPVYETGENDLSSFPTHWTEDLSTNHMHLIIDAEIDFGGMTEFPVYSVTRSKMPDELKLAMIHAMFPELEAAYKDMFCTKEEWAEIIANVMRGTEKRLEDGTVEYVSWPDQEAYLNECKDAYKRALPEDKMYRPVQAADLLKDNTTFTVRQANGKKGWIVFTKIGNDLDLLLNNAGIKSYLQRESFYVSEVWDESERVIKMHPSLNEEEAKTKAEQFFAEIGMDMPDWIFSEPARIYSAQAMSVISEGYYLRYRQNAGYGGVYYPQFSPIGGALKIDPKEQYRSTWNMETIELYIDDTGVRWLHWSNPVEIGECLNPNVKILDYDALQQHIRNLLRAGMRDKSGYSTVGYEMTDMRLTVFPIPLLENRGYALVPTWYLSFAHYEMDHMSDDTYVKRLDPELRMAILINAVDGSCIMVPDGALQ